MLRNILMLLLALAFVCALGMRATRNQPTALAYYAVDTASDDDYLAQVNGISSYDAGLFVMLNPVTDNTGACTLNINGLGAKTILDSLGSNTPANSYIDAAGITTLCYDGTNFVITSNDANP